MPCVPAPPRLPAAGVSSDVFAFSPAQDGLARGAGNLVTLLAMPWTAFWAVALESLDPENYRTR